MLHDFIGYFKVMSSRTVLVFKVPDLGSGFWSSGKV